MSKRVINWENRSFQLQQHILKWSIILRLSNAHLLEPMSLKSPDTAAEKEEKMFKSDSNPGYYDLHPKT